MRDTGGWDGRRKIRRAAWGGMVAGWAMLAARPVPARAAAAPTWTPASGVVLVVVAHPDDWQLFLGEAVVEALRRGERVVAVVTSAGGDDRPDTFWKAREAGAVASMGAALALAYGSTPAPPVVCRPQPLVGPLAGAEAGAGAGAGGGPGGGGGVAPRLCEAPGGRMATVFLRLPDGRGDGSGFSRTGHQSLLRLEGGTIPRLDAVDGSGAYWSTAAIADAIIHLVGALRVPNGGGVGGATGWGGIVRVLTHDPERRFNPLDHADHRVTGRVALAVARRVGAPATVYSGYSNVKRGDNLSAEQSAWKAWLFVAYDREMLAVSGRWSAYAENAWAHASYLGRSYGRVWGGVTAATAR